MKGYNSLEERMKNPSKDIIDWEYLLTHPESKFLVWEKYQINPYEIDAKRKTDAVFDMKFRECFSSFINEESTRKR